MKKEIDCQIFEDQLDELLNGTLPEEGVVQLHHHSLSCYDCAMLLKVQEHLALPSLEEIEAAVPDEILASLWPRVQAGVQAEPVVVSANVPADVPSSKVSSVTIPAGIPRPPFGPLGSGETPLPRRFPWLAPTLAAASVILLFSTGFLFSELRQTKARGNEMAEQIVELERGMAELDPRTEWVERTAQLAGSGRNRARALNYALAGQESITVEALVELLGNYPADMVLFKASQLQNLLGTSVRPPPELRELFGLLADALTTFGERNEVRAGDLAKWLATSGLPPDMVVPKSPLIELLS
ncbi:MAG: hypothetical protein ABIF09_02925 [Gemmatimonadota bacterium]